MESDRKLVVHVGGARGVGKSRVLDHVLENFRTETRVTVLPVSRVVSQLGKEMFGQGWETLKCDQKDAVRIIYVQRIKKIKQGVHILDSHYVDIIANKNIRLIIPSELLPLIDVHIIVECPIDLLLARRQADVSRTRSLDTEIIEIELGGEFNHAQKITGEFGKPLFVIPNEGDPVCAANQICAIIKSQWQRLNS